MRWLFALFLLISPAVAEDLPKQPPVIHHTGDDGGGEILTYIAKYSIWDYNKDLVIVDGECVSACTIMLGIIDPGNMCATDNAEFGFHSAWSEGGVYTPEGTLLLWVFYQGRTARVLRHFGWRGPSPHPQIIYIEARQFIRPCQPKDLNGEK